jgi:hypothetical protein
MYPLTTTTARIDSCRPCDERRHRLAQLLGIAEPSEEPISYVKLLDVLGLEDALWCCRAEPDLAPIWRRYAHWCAQQVQHLMTDERSQAVLDVAQRYANGGATDAELAADRAAAAASRAADRDAAIAAAIAAAWAAAWAAIRAAVWAAARQKQAAAFRQLVETGTLPT